MKPRSGNQVSSSEVKEFHPNIEFHANTLARSRYTFPILVLIVITGFDLLTKDVAVTFWKGTAGMPVIEQIISFDYEESSEGIFQLGKDLPPEVKRPLYVSAGIIGFVFICWLAFRLHVSTTGMYGLVFVTAGAAGNIGYRIVRGYLISFIHLRTGAYDWPIFNLADLYLDIGLALMLIDVIYIRWKARESQKI